MSLSTVRHMISSLGLPYKEATRGVSTCALLTDGGSAALITDLQRLEQLQYRVRSAGT